MTQFTDAPDVAAIISRYESRISALERTRALALTPVTSLPVAPFEGQEIIFSVDEAAGVYWRFRYRALNADGSANVSLHKWEFIGGPPLRSSIATQESRAAATYNNLATIGPTVINPLRGDYLVRVGAGIQAAATGTGYMSVQIGGAGAADTDAAYVVGLAAATNEAASAGPQALKVDVTGNNAFAAKYRSTVGTALFQNRWIELLPVRVG